MDSKSPLLYTWVDVDNIFIRERLNPGWPEHIADVHCYWDGVTIYIPPNTQEKTFAWINDVFGNRFDAQEQCIYLEPSGERKRLLAINLDIDEDNIPLTSQFNPSFGHPRAPRHANARVPKLTSWEKLAGDRAPEIVVFHGFTDAMNRSAAALALAHSLAGQGKKTLLVDSDLAVSALSSSWLTRNPNVNISYTDMLALIHSDPSSERGEALEICSSKLRGPSDADLQVLPAFRTQEMRSSLEIKPEHLVNADNPFPITEFLVRLGAELAVGSVIVDLSAGFSEFAAPLLLDPRVLRVFVSGAGKNSIINLKTVLNLISRDAFFPQQDMHFPEPVCILGYAPEAFMPKRWFTNLQSEILNAGGSLFKTAGKKDLFIWVPFSYYRSSLRWGQNKPLMDKVGKIADLST